MSCSTRPLAPSHPSCCRIRHGMWDGTGTQPTTRWVFPLNPRSPGSPRGARPLLLVGFVLLLLLLLLPFCSPALPTLPYSLETASFLIWWEGPGCTRWVRTQWYLSGRPKSVGVLSCQPPLHLEVSVAPGHRRGSSRGG